MGGAGSGNFKTSVDREVVCGLVRDTSLTFAQIGVHLGLSRERVRQIAWRHCGITAKDRTLREVKLPPEHPFVADAAMHGISCYGVDARSLYANERLCRMGKAFMGGHQRRYIQINTFCIDAEFGIWALPDGRWLILPREKWPRTVGLFALYDNRTNRKGGYLNRHDYRDYINAWHLLGGEMEILEQVPREIIRFGSERWKVVVDKLPSIADGMALPVKCADPKEAMNLQSFLFARQNHNGYTGQKYSVERRKETVYISKAEAIR